MTKERFSDFQDGYHYFLNAVNEMLDGTETRRRIEIAEWQLGIHNPYSEIAYVDLEGNPVYKEWTLLNTRRNLQNALLRPGKSNMVAARIEKELKKIKE